MGHGLIGVKHSLIISTALSVIPTHATAGCGGRHGEDRKRCEAESPGFEWIEGDGKENRDAFEEKWRHERERKCGQLEGQSLESCNRRLDQEREIDERRQILRREFNER
jgi:hypothetical protein